MRGKLGFAALFLLAGAVAGALSLVDRLGWASVSPAALVAAMRRREWSL